MKFQIYKNNSSFTLIELLVVLALVAILSVVVILTLNPAELIKQARDSNRLSDLSTINTALNLFSADVTSGFMGTSTVVYVSIPSASPTCSGVGLPTLPATYTYNCVTTANLRNTNGTGWIPVNFQRISSNSPISQLPVDPINTTSTRLYYTYVSGGSWELNANIEASKNKLGGSGDVVSKDGGSALSLYEIGNNLNLNPMEIGDPSLVGYWSFEEGSGGTVYDRSGNGNHGTWYGGGTHYAVGRVGSYAGQFNGSTDYISVPDSPSLRFGVGNLSMFVIMKTSNAGVLNRIITKYDSSTSFDGYFYFINSNTIFGGTLDNGGYYGLSNGVTNVTNGIWRSTGFSFARNVSTKIYVDGQDDTQVVQVAGNNNVDVSNPLLIGQYGSANHFNGLLDEIRIYNRALSAAEALALYNAAK